LAAEEERGDEKRDSRETQGLQGWKGVSQPRNISRYNRPLYRAQKRQGVFRRIGKWWAGELKIRRKINPKKSMESSAKSMKNKEGAKHLGICQQSILDLHKELPGGFCCQKRTSRPSGSGATTEGGGPYGGLGGKGGNVELCLKINGVWAKPFGISITVICPGGTPTNRPGCSAQEGVPGLIKIILALCPVPHSKKQR